MSTIKLSALIRAIDEVLIEHKGVDALRAKLVGLQPKPQIAPDVRDEAFACLAHFPRYERIGREEIEEAACEGCAHFRVLGEAELMFDSRAASPAEAPEGVSARLALVRAALPPGGECYLRLHRGGYKGSTHFDVEGWGILVILRTEGGLELSREYDGGQIEDWI